MFETLLKTLAVALQLWDDKEKHKYIDQLISLKQEYHDEYNKNVSDRSDAVLDDVEFRLRILALAFSTSAGKQDATNQP